MKCGRAVAFGQAFCKDCLADMDRHPVKSDTPIQLPPSPPTHTPRRTTHSRKPRKPEDQLIRLRKVVRIQTFLLIITFLLLMGSTVFFMFRLRTVQQSLQPGQNYSTVEATTP